MNKIKKILKQIFLLVLIMQYVNIYAQTDFEFIKDISADSAKYLALKYLKTRLFTEAQKHITAAYILETDSLKKADNYYYAAITDFALKNYPEAKKLALQSARYNQKNGKPYILIAKLYASSTNSCEKNHFEKNAVYWVAVDKLNEAKRVDPSCINDANKLIKIYSARFPEYHSCFPTYANEKIYKIGCWINETTTMR